METETGTPGTLWNVVFIDLDEMKMPELGVVSRNQPWTLADVADLAFRRAGMEFVDEYIAVAGNLKGDYLEHLEDANEFYVQITPDIVHVSLGTSDDDQGEIAFSDRVPSVCAHFSRCK